MYNSRSLLLIDRDVLHENTKSDNLFDTNFVLVDAWWNEKHFSLFTQERV